MKRKDLIPKLSREEWLKRAESRLLKRTGGPAESEKVQKNIREWAEAIYENRDEEEWPMTPEEEVDEELSYT